MKQRFPECLLEVHVKPGMPLPDMVQRDSYSYELAVSRGRKTTGSSRNVTGNACGRRRSGFPPLKPAARRSLCEHPNYM